MRHRHCNSAAPRRAAGFTLVEILTVIALLAILAALLGRATTQALRKARETRISNELSQMQNAMTEFKTKYGSFPPSLGGALEDTPATTYPSETTAQRQGRIMRFLAKAFPRYVPDPSAVSQYVDWQTRMAYATLWNPNFSNDSLSGAGNLAVWVGAGKNCCNVDTLDPAEMLVLWLGGVPRRRANSSNGIVFELTGFGADPAQPFVMAVSRAEWNTATAGAGKTSWEQRGLVDNQRTPRLFPFDSGRLRDADGDGWPEYFPLTPPNGPPYVYFSAQDYAFRPAYPYSDSSTDNNFAPDDNTLTPTSELTLLARSGLAKPYASTVNAGNPATTNYNNWQITWAQPDTFQIISAGENGVYGGRPTFTGDTAVPSVTEEVADVRLVPEGVLVRVFGGAVQRLGLADSGDADNLTSFSIGRLEDDITGKK